MSRYNLQAERFPANSQVTKLDGAAHKRAVRRRKPYEFGSRSKNRLGSFPKGPMCNVIQVNVYYKHAPVTESVVERRFRVIMRIYSANNIEIYYADSVRPLANGFSRLAMQHPRPATAIRGKEAEG